MSWLAMSDVATLEQHLTATLSLTRRPVAIAFRDSPPAGVARLPGTQPAGCSFWRLAANGQVFCTVPPDLPSVAAELDTITTANAALADYHRSRRAALAAQ